MRKKVNYSCINLVKYLDFTIHTVKFKDTNIVTKEKYYLN